MSKLLSHTTKSNFIRQGITFSNQGGSGHNETPYINQLISKALAENIIDLSDNEIERVFKNTLPNNIKNFKAFVNQGLIIKQDLNII